MNTERPLANPDLNFRQAAENIARLQNNYLRDSLINPVRTEGNGMHDIPSPTLTEDFLSYAELHLGPTGRYRAGTTLLPLGKKDHHFPSWVRTTLDHRRRNKTLAYSESYLLVRQNDVKKYTLQGPTTNFFSVQQPFFPSESGFLGFKQFEEMDPMGINIGKFEKTPSGAITYSEKDFKVTLEAIDGKNTFLTPSEIRDATGLNQSFEIDGQVDDGEDEATVKLLQTLDRVEHAARVSQSVYRPKFRRALGDLTDTVRKQGIAQLPLEIATHQKYNSVPVLFLPDIGEVVTRSSEDGTSTEVPDDVFFDVINGAIDFLLARVPKESPRLSV